MKTVLWVLLIAAAAGFTGCDSMSYKQYVIRSASPADQKSVATALLTAASVVGLKDCTSESAVPKTIAYYKEQVEHFPVSLGARIAAEDVVVDLTCFHPGWIDPPAFKAVDSVLSKELPKAFGDRLIVDPKPLVPFPDRKVPNKAPEPTLGSVTPRATE